MVVGDWGGQDDPPYYTDLRRSKTDGRQLAWELMQLTLNMGDNISTIMMMWMTLALIMC